jgi:signal transduction histidine kinase/DNA-binding response OmpR family regulator
VRKAAEHADELVLKKKAAETVAEQQAALARSEEAYREQTKILRSVLDSMSEGVLVADQSGKMLVLNSAATDLVGPSAGNTLRSEWGEQYGIYVPGTDTVYPADELPLARAMRGENADAIELHVRNERRPDGIYVSVNVRALKDDSGEIKGGVAVVRDVTASKSFEEALRKAKEEAERANRAKSEFLSRMSHELRTPLNSILGFAQLLGLSELAPQHRDNIQHILKGGYHLLELINEVLDLARIEAGRLGLSLEPVRIDEAVQDALDLVRPIAAGRNISVSADTAGYGGSYVLADGQRLKQVLLNLFSNAIKFNRPDGLVVLTCRRSGADRLSIEIADTGPGIDEAGLKKIFTPFERLNADRNAVSGTGLGLALSKHMVEAMGGTMGVASEPGTGSRFHFNLALVEHFVERIEEVRSPAASSSGHEGLIRGSVLYIEDNLSNVRLIAEIVSRYPRIQLLEAMQGGLGLALARSHTPDWILLDLHLPDLTGEEVLLHLRADPRTAGIPVTILSADATPGQIKNLKASGARDYLTKPIDVRQVIELLESTLSPGEAASPARDGVSPQLAPKDEPATMQSWASDTVPLDGLPDELIEQMRIAIEDGQKGRLDELIAVVANRKAPCARALKDLADNYEYDTLTNLLSGVQV